MKYLGHILVGLLVSFYFYTFAFSFAPWLSSKILVTMIGVVMFAFQSLQGSSFKIDIDIVTAAILALLFSFSCLLSIMANGTRDMSYVTYIVSFAIWTFGAYALCSIIRIHHGRLDLKLVTNYLAWVALFQCILSQLIAHIPAVMNFVDSLCSDHNSLYHELNRLYGLGAGLDPAGVRFSIVELLIVHQLLSGARLKSKEIWFYYISFFTILVLGCMISRTTTVGAVLSIAYVVLKKLISLGRNLNPNRFKSFGILILVLCIAIPVVVHLYNTDSETHQQLRFAFEGFFNWAETGVWRTDSTDKLNSNMWIWPTDSTGWLIGYGLFGNWAYGTDIGYCRFTLYCGLIGLSIFIYFFMFLSQRFAKRNPGTGMLALMFFALTLGVWVKVATDTYIIYAILLSIRSVNLIYDRKIHHVR